MATCASNLARTLFFAVNLIFWILGIVVIAIGIYSRVENDSWDALLDTSAIFSAANLLIAAGVIVAIVGFLGCCGAVKKVQWMLMGYCGIVILIFILEIAGGIYAYTKRDEVESQFTSKVKTVVEENYGESGDTGKAFKTAVDWFQKTVECCGASGPIDWQTSKWYTTYAKDPVSKDKVPDSCCKTESAGCGKKDKIYTDKDTIYTKGCIEQGKTFVKDNLYLVGGVGVGIAVVQLLAILMGACLICSFKDDEGNQA